MQLPYIKPETSLVQSAWNMPYNHHAHCRTTHIHAGKLQINKKGEQAIQNKIWMSTLIKQDNV